MAHDGRDDGPPPDGVGPGLAALIARKWKVARVQPAFVLLWLVPVWVMIGLSSLVIALVPFRRLAPLLGRSIGAVALVPLASEAQLTRARQIAGVIGIAARYAPFRSDCLPQAMVAQALCRAYRVPSAMHLGAKVTREQAVQTLLAHAWVVSGRVAVSGRNESFRRYRSVGCFVSPSLLPD